MVLEQTKGRRKKIFKIDETGILVTSVSKGKLPSEEHIAYENIRSDRVSHTVISYQYLLGTGIGFMIALISLSSGGPQDGIVNWIMILWGGGAAICTLFFFFHRPTTYFVKTFSGKYIRFLNTKNSKQIESFVKAVIVHRNEYLKFKYSTPIPYLDYKAQHANLDVLHREKIISREEYEEKLTKLKGFFHQQQSTTPSIGYSEN